MEPPSTNTTELSWEDFSLDKKLGTGTFATVYSLKAIHSHWLATKPNKPKGLLSSNNSAEEEKEEITEVTLLEEEEDGPIQVCQGDSVFREDASAFALKCISQEILKSKESTSMAIKCLQQESHILAHHLPEHGNIIKMYGASMDPEDPTRGFILLERLRFTLEDQLIAWKLRANIRNQLGAESKGLLAKLFPINRRVSIQEQERQSHHQARVTQTALQLSKAMSFVHQHGIIYRDLKPANIGFNQTGQVILFDFGFARSVKKDPQDPDDTRLLTLLVGTPRYMSPEMSRKDGQYGFPSDVHSFAMILWEMMTLRKPFSEIKHIKSLRRALHNHRRPRLNSISCKDMRELLKVSWDPNPNVRPTFALIAGQLQSLAKVFVE